MAFSPNGQWIVTSNADDNSLRLWDISSGLPISTFSGHADQIWTFSFSPSCAQIASGDEEGHVRLWEVDTGRAILNLDGPAGPVRTVTYCPDGRSILSSNDGQGVQQWNFLTGEPAPPPRKIAGDVSLYAFSPDGIQIATGHKDGTIRLWSRQADTVECTLLGHPQTVLELAYSPCGRWIVSVTRDGARLWDMHTNEHPGLIAEVYYGGQKYASYCVAFTPSSQIVLSLQDFKLRLYDPRAQDPCTVLKTLESIGFGTIVSMDCSPGGQEVAIGAWGNGTVHLWDFQPDKICTELKGHDLEVSSVAYSPCGQWILSGSKDKTVRVWRFGAGEANSWSCVGVVRGCSDSISSVAWNPVAALEFVTGCDDSSVRIWRIASHDNMDGGDVSVQMLWGNDVGILCASDLSLQGAIGLSPINQKLLLQRGAKGDSLHSEDDGLSKEEDKASEEEDD
ncbi:U3 snoRNP protein [Mortierella alpina]|uniref:U3 snoRNP protein n=1 Tax=Mortierella alpina TaxID=64518 RepID=A0A9P6IRL5_MORAP|nr:U3 snoRNP protein [Mortierella alpina]